MLFTFLKYISPTWYFNLIPEDQSIPYFVDYRKLRTEEHDLLDIDDGYKTLHGKLADAAYQAWQKGIIKSDPRMTIYSSGVISRPANYRTVNLFGDRNVKVSDESAVTNVNDNYRFIRRFFHPGISWHIFFVRLLSFHNPLMEIPAFVRSLKISRVDLYSRNAFELYADQYNGFDSELIKSNPKVSVIIPTLNRYEYLKDVLADLEKQTYRNIEVIVCDQSEPFDNDFYRGWELDIKLIRQEEKALWLARNTMIKKSSGEFLALTEDDMRIKPDWLFQHLKCLDFFRADISAGVFYPEATDIPWHKKYVRWAEQLATGNAMIRKGVFVKTGLFDRQFEGQRSGDGEFGLRCHLLGFTSISNPFAACEDRKVPTGGLRQMGSWDSFRPTKLFAPRPVPSVLYLGRKYFGNHSAKLMLLFTIPGSIVPYKYKSKKWLRILSGISMILILPFLMLQVLFSWHQAGLKLRQGAMIEIFK